MGMTPRQRLRARYPAISTHADELASIRQTDASFQLEGFHPTELRRAINAAVLAGRVTRAQVAIELNDYAERHKSLDGFIQSRIWK